MNFKPTYLKLTLFYVLIVMTISVSFSIVIYQISIQELGRGLNLQSGVFRSRPDLVGQGGPDRILPIPFQEIEKIRAEQLQTSNDHLRLNLIYFNLLILVLSTSASYFLAKKTLKPIKENIDKQNRFTADASHELKTPLTAMRTEIEVELRNKKISLEDTKKLLNSNLEEIAKLESLTNALLKLAKYQEDLVISFEKLQLSDLVTQAYEKIETLASEKSIEFSNEFKEAYVKGDKQSLVELFVILLDNAIKYSPNGSKISINIFTDKKFAFVKITDQGIGIKSSDIPYIFNRFYRADNSRSKEKVSGYGLGLSIAKSIVEVHSGNLDVTSKIAKGSEFTVKLPLL